MKRINLEGYIISEEDRWIYDYFEVPYSSIGMIRAFLADANGEDIEAYINSAGGDVIAASAMYNELRKYAGNSTAIVTGMSASASTLLMLGFDKVVGTPTSSFMIHNISTGAQGDYRVMEHTAEMLKVMNETLINAYEAKAGDKVNRETLQKYLDAETWMSAQDALAIGLIDEIELKEGEVLTTPKQSMLTNRMAACFSPEKMRVYAERLKPEQTTNQTEDGGECQPVSDINPTASIRKKLLDV